MANPATHPREDKRANRSRALHHSISLKRALVTATDTAPRKSQRPEGRWGKRSGQYGLQAKSMPPQAPYRPYHEPSAMPARSKTPTGVGAYSRRTPPHGQLQFGDHDHHSTSTCHIHALGKAQKEGTSRKLHRLSSNLQLGAKRGPDNRYHNTDLSKA